VVVNLAFPPRTATVPRTVAPSMKVTVPTGVPRIRPLVFTEAVNVTARPRLVVLRLVVRTVMECCAPEFGDVAGVGASAGAGVGGAVEL
jgi:hypothetical protein